MIKHTWLPIIVSLLALAFLDPFMYLMPTGSTWIILGGLLVATSAYGFFVLTEKANDEREVSIRAFADRISCLLGMSLLVMTIAYHLFTNGIIYPEIIIILVVMVISKSVAQWYACNKL